MKGSQQLSNRTRRVQSGYHCIFRLQNLPQDLLGCPSQQDRPKKGHSGKFNLVAHEGSETVWVCGELLSEWLGDGSELGREVKAEGSMWWGLYSHGLDTIGLQKII